MVQDVDVLKRNCAEFARTSKAVEILREANGKLSYTEIAKLVGVHKNQASVLLKKANDFGLATRIKPGYYKKISHIADYLPKLQKSKALNNSISTLNLKLKKRKLFSKPLQGINPSSKIFATVDKMADAYRHLYAVENILRELIRKVIANDKDWWKNRVSPGVQKVVREGIQNTPYDAAPRNDELEHTHLGQLKEIIISKKNWEDFKPYLHEKDKNKFAVMVDKAIPSRNSIGHCIPLKTKDLKIVDVRFQDILDMLK